MPEKIETRKFKPGDNERKVILLPKKVPWYLALLNLILDRYPLEKYIVEKDQTNNARKDTNIWVPNLPPP